MSNPKPVDARDPIAFLFALAAKSEAVSQYPTPPFGNTVVAHHPDLVRQILTQPAFQRTDLLKTIIGNGLAASEGPYWKQQRATLSPAFAANPLKQALQGMGEEIRLVLPQWQQAASEGRELVMNREITRVALRAVIRNLFGVPVTDVEALAKAVQDVVYWMGPILRINFGEPCMLGVEEMRSMREALQVMDEYLLNILAIRRAQPPREGDMISLLLQSRDKTSGQPLSDSQLRDELITMLIGGHENISLMVAWALYLLSEHPAQADALATSLRQNLSEPVPLPEDLPAIEGCRQVLNEAMRLHPPIWFLSRKAIEDQMLGNLEVSAGSPVVIPICTLHRHPDFWSDPDDFQPRRFADGASGKNHPYAFLPFGGGPHHCIGSKMAMAESQILLAALVRNFRLHRTGPAVNPYPAFSLRMEPDFLARLECRT